MKQSKSSWATAGGLLLGMGVGFFFLPNGLYFAGSMFVGLGVGLVVSAMLDKKSK